MMGEAEGWRVVRTMAGLMVLATATIAGQTQNPIPALEQRLSSPLSDQDQIEVLNQLGALLTRTNPQRALELGQRALDLAKRNRDARGQAFAHKSLGLSLLVLERSAEGLPHMQQANELFAGLGDRSEAARTLGYCGMLLSAGGKLWPAINAGQGALAIFRELGDVKGMAAATNNLGVLFNTVGDYQKALEYNLESLRLEESLGRKIGIANNLNSIGNIYSQLGDHLKARDHYMRALPLFEELGEKAGAAKVLNNIGNTFEKTEQNDEALKYFSRALAIGREIKLRAIEADALNNRGIVFKKRRRWDDALREYVRVLDLQKAIGDSGGLASTYHNIAEIYLLEGRPDDALGYLAKALVIGKETRSNEQLEIVYRLMAQCYEAKGEYRNAYENQVLSSEARAVMLDQQRNRKIAELQEKYEAEKRGREIALLGKDNELLRKDSEIRRLALSRTRLVAGLAAAVTCLLVGAVLLAFRRYLYLVAFWKKRTFIGHYRIEGEISSGGMGVVYRATSLTNPGTTVALKVIRDELAADERQRQRFINEGRIIDALDHPNIVKVLDRGEHNERLYIAMEYLEGRSLAVVLQDHAARGQLVPLKFCTVILTQLVDAVTTIHSKGIVHRDISPANVIVIEPAATPVIKLLDFGIAKLDTATTLTEAGEILGTINYMAPERIQFRELTPASDVFSLGVLAYELITLHKPFLADEPLEVLKQVLTREPIDPTLYRPETPPALASLVMAMLRKDPMKRPGDEELRHCMARVLGEPA